MPTVESQWRHETVNLSAYAGQANVAVRFKGTSADGNNAFLDNINFTATAGLIQLASEEKFTIYPNPTSKQATIQFNSNGQDNVNIRIVNAIGQVVYSEELKNSKGLITHAVNTENFANGIYQVTVITGNSFSTQKLNIIK